MPDDLMVLRLAIAESTNDRLSRLVDEVIRQYNDLERELEEESAWSAANAARAVKAARHRTQAASFRAQGVSANRIGRLIADSERRQEPYPSRTVREWLRKSAVSG